MVFDVKRWGGPQHPKEVDPDILNEILSDEIGSLLIPQVMSVHTAKQHVTQILRKQGMRRRIDLAAWAHEHDLGGNGSRS